MNRFHPKGYKNPQQIKAIKAKEKLRNKPAVSFATDAESKTAFKKARIELLNNIPTKSDSKEVVARKKKRYNEIAIVLARFNKVGNS